MSNDLQDQVHDQMSRRTFLTNSAGKSCLQCNEKSKSYFTGKESCVPITFPYIPTKEYKEWIEE